MRFGFQILSVRFFPFREATPVSTQDQNLGLQVEALTGASCRKVFEDKISGSRAERPRLAKALDMLREDDTLVVWKLDRLGRSVKNLVDLVGGLHQRGIQFKSLTGGAYGRCPSNRGSRTDDSMG